MVSKSLEMVGPAFVWVIVIDDYHYYLVVVGTFNVGMSKEYVDILRAYCTSDTYLENHEY